MGRVTVTKRRIVYYRGLFVKGATINRSDINNIQNLKGQSDIQGNVTVEWTSYSELALSCTDDQVEWLMGRGFGIPVDLTVTLDGMPDEEEPG